MSRKLILLDIDYTTFHEETPRPYLKEFLERTLATHDVGFYTAANHWRLNFVLRYLQQTFGFSREVVRQIQRNSMSRERCPMISYKLEPGAYIDIKCLQKAADVLRRNKADLILLDDMPMHDNPDVAQHIQAPGFWGQGGDSYLQDLDITAPSRPATYTRPSGIICPVPA